MSMILIMSCDREVQSLAVWIQSLVLWTLRSEMQTARIGTRNKYVCSLYFMNVVSLSLFKDPISYML
jgi:dimeric dUTPase (all-alpha-NTP-PPase superfamily)